MRSRQSTPSLHRRAILVKQNFNIDQNRARNPHIPYYVHWIHGRPLDGFLWRRGHQVIVSFAFMFSLPVFQFSLRRLISSASL